MPSLDKESVTEQVDSITKAFHKLNADGKLPPEATVLMQSMLTIIQLIMSIFMEKYTKKTSKNSGLPPSQTEKDNTDNTSTPGSNKKRQALNGSLSSKRERTTIDLAEVTVCECCGENLTQVAPTDTERRTRIDIIFEKVTQHVDADIKHCPTCDTLNKGRFPEDMPGPVQYGVGVKAYVLNLLVTQMASLNRAQQLLHALIDQVVSEATLLKYIMQLYWALEVWETQSIDWLLTQQALHVDETSMRVDKKNHWIHVYSSGDTTLKFLHPKRGKEAIEAIHIIPRYGGTIIHDCWASYLSYDHCQHGLCGSHLLRELVFVIESNNYRWANNMKKLLQQTCKTVAGSADKQLSEKDYAKLQKRYRNILTRAEKEMPLIPAKPNGKRGKIAKSDAHNLWERLKFHEVAVLLFAKKPEVAFTNNRAERDLRMAKVKQKVSGCFRKQAFAKAYCRISSYLQTMSARGYNPLVAVEMALSGKIYMDRGE